MAQFIVGEIRLTNQNQSNKIVVSPLNLALKLFYFADMLIDYILVYLCTYLYVQ